MKVDPINANPHWNLQLSSCPFCSADFKIIGKTEEMATDTAYLISRAGLTQLINPYLHKNPTFKTRSNNSNDWAFWVNIGEHLILKAYRAYKLDFDIFEYDPSAYFERIGLPHKAEAFK